MSGDRLLWALLALTVASAWIGALAALRMRAALDRLHAVAFVNVASGGLLVLAGFAAEGASTRTLKVLALYALLLVSGAALAHATGRALLIREGRKA